MLSKTFQLHVPIIVLSDDGSHLCRQMLASYSSSLATGTVLNRRKQAQEYIKFALIYGVPYLSPSPTQACMFAQHLANKHSSPASIKNYLSGARSWIIEHLGSIQGFLSPQFAQLVKGFTKNSTHVPARAPPLLPHHVRAICRALDSTRSAPLAIKPAILIGYTCFLRASNILSPTMLEWGGPHTLIAADITSSTAGLQVFIRSTKTRSDPLGLTFFIPRSAPPDFCPVASWDHYRQRVRPWALGPAFIHMNRLPITSTQVVQIMRAALASHQDIPAQRVSMHSLRRGATQAAVDQGLPLQEIKNRGTWKSNAGIRPYLDITSSSVPALTASNLAN